MFRFFNGFQSIFHRILEYRGASGVLPKFNMKITKMFLVILKAIEKSYIPNLCTYVEDHLFFNLF